MLVALIDGFSSADQRLLNSSFHGFIPMALIGGLERYKVTSNLTTAMRENLQRSRHAAEASSVLLTTGTKLAIATQTRHCDDASGTVPRETLRRLTVTTATCSRTASAMLPSSQVFTHGCRNALIVLAGR